MAFIESFYKKVNIDKEYINKNELSPVYTDEESEKFYRMVFAPDPVTNNPTSDIGYVLSGADPQFKQFIIDKLMQSRPTEIVSDSADEAMALVRKNVMTDNEYENYCREYVVNMMNSNND